jgi:putative spermidine/putrescine transport system ATP-binding protein
VAELELDGLTKRYGRVTALDRFSLRVGTGEFVSLLGPSGCGKTTALRIIAGFIRPNEGSVRIDATDTTSIPPHQRDIGMVFQNYALFPHMTVTQNVEFGLKMRKVPREEAAKRVGQALELVQLRGLEQRYPTQLSGGQQQRVAVARAIVINPTLLLLDEPLSNLDAKLRVDTREEIRRLQRQLGVTTIFVTHDQEEALTISDRIAVMSAGRLEQEGTPQELYNHPRTAFVANFIGTANLFAGQVIGRQAGTATVALRDSSLRVEVGTDGGLEPTEALVMVRPERIGLHAPGEAPPGPNSLPGRITLLTFVGATVRHHVMLDGGPRVLVDLPNQGSNRWRQDDVVVVAWRPEHSVLVPVDAASGPGA